MTNRGILFIEDDTSGREMGVFNLEKAGFEVDAAADGDAGLKLFSPQKHVLVITDLKMPGLSGMEVLKEIKSQAPHVPVLVITAYANVELAVEAMKLGAFDFIGKPFNRDHLILTVKKALENSRLSREVSELRIKATGVERPIVHQSDAMRRVLAMIDKVANSDATVLVMGESGTGKELLARRIHVHSQRAGKPFITVNAASMPGELLESELFGHEKGAFTDATRSRMGRFRQADGGTLFLDEIGELPAGLQKKLLRVLQERSVEVVGRDIPIPVDVRIVAATNKHLKKEVDEGRFREDLLYRLNVVEITIPPLRHRPEDLPVLIPHFIDKYAEKRELTIPPTLVEILQAHPWPGNVRELENVCQRLVVLCTGTQLRLDDLPTAYTRTNPIDAALSENVLEGWPVLPKDGFSLFDMERTVIERVLDMKGGNVSQAAVYLNIPRHVLAYRMEKYGIVRKPDAS
jgi:two-component system NtrC family response regulator